MLRVASLFSNIGKCNLWRCASGEVLGAQRTENLREVAGDSYVILPIPSFDKSGMLNGAGHISAEELFRSLPCGSQIFGGRISPLIRTMAKEYGHRLYDYGEREDFNLLNAVPTAEAAILIAMEHSAQTVHGGSFCVFGYGKIGKALSARLSDLGGGVTVVARSDEALACAECDGHIPLRISDIEKSIHKYNVCFNTIPHPILNEEIIKSWECPVFIELASLPGGFSEDALKHLSDKYISALSLPGRYFPVTAGEIIYKTVLTMIKATGGKI